MATTLFYCIAGHNVAIDFDDEDDSLLLPSFDAFKAAATDSVIATVAVGEQFRFAAKGDAVGQFDCGGAMYGVYRTGDGEYQFEINHIDGTLCSMMQSSADFTYHTVAITARDKGLRAYGLNNAMMLAYTFATSGRGTLLMHSSVIMNGGRGYMFLGKSGTGKSTHTSLWRKYIPGSELLNDDNPVLRVIDRQAIVYGSPWSGKTPCYRNLSAPVGGIVMLQKKPENTIKREGVIGALTALLPSVSTMRWERGVHSGVIDTIQQVIATTPIYTLGCRPDEEAARLSYTTLVPS